MMDACIERDEGEYLDVIFDGVVRLARPESLSEAQAEQELKVLLAQLALHGVAYDVCEHYTAKQAYQLLVDKICREERVFPQLRNTQWVQHFSTSDFCPACDEEALGDDEKYAEQEADLNADEVPDSDAE